MNRLFQDVIKDFKETKFYKYIATYFWEKINTVGCLKNEIKNQTFTKIKIK